ncbi:Mis6-domain-containing protein [Sporodiniella umbellata]|nr:Mis6-domain-containing protein [Sporodiniella umbellata]
MLVLRQNTPVFMTLSPVVKKFGLSPTHFNNLFRMVLSKKLVLKRRVELVSLLLPREKIPEECIIRAIAMIPNHPLDLSKRLLQWIVSVYDIIDSDEGQFQNTYQILFHYLTIAGIRVEICHLLYFMTKRERVTRFRVRKVKEMIENERDNGALIALLTVYKSYDHTIEIPYNVRLRGATVFEHPDPLSKDYLINIRRLWTNREEELDLHRPTISFTAFNKKRARKDKDMPPSNTEQRHLDIDEVLRTAENVDKLDVLEQLNTVLENRLLQHVIVCNPDESLVLRIGYWLDQQLLYLIRWPNSKDPGKTELKQLLEKLIKLTQFTKAQLPIVEEFLKEYIKSWNGFEVQEEIFTLIPYLKPDSFQRIYRDVLKPLEGLFSMSDTVWRAKLILCYTEWLKNWALLDWKKHTELKQDAEKEVDSVTWLFEGLSFDTDYSMSMQAFVMHVDRLCVIGSVQENDSILFQHAALSFFEFVSLISAQPNLVTPTAPFVYKHFFSTSAMATNRICNIIYQYKVAFEEDESLMDEEDERFRALNEYISSLCTALWKSVGFLGTKAVFCMSRPSIDKLIKTCGERGTEIENMLSLTQSAALAGFSKRFMQGLEKDRLQHDEPIGADYLSRLENEGGIAMTFQEYRIQLLDHLKEQGMTGIYDLLYSSIKSLVNKKSEEP